MKIRPEDLTGEARARFDTWRRLGFSEAGAMRQVEADGLLPSDAFDQLHGALQRLGASESVAHRATVGRAVSEDAVRRTLTEAGASEDLGDVTSRDNFVASAATELDKLLGTYATAEGFTDHVTDAKTWGTFLADAGKAAFESYTARMTKQAMKV